jgi:hypothetical protein
VVPFNREPLFVSGSGLLKMKQKIKPKLLKSIDLASGLKLELYDTSIKVAGDRWLVALTAIIDIIVDETIIAAQGHFNVNEIKEILGEVIRFEQKRERHFIDKKDKDNVLQNLMNSFLMSSLSYLSHPDFAKKYVLKVFKNHLVRKTWYPEKQNSAVGSL